MGVEICGFHFMRAGTDLYCDLNAGHEGEHGLLSDHGRVRVVVTSSSTDKTVNEQKSVFDRALEIHRDRTKVYGMLWTEDKPLDQSYMVKHKAKRLNKVLLDAHVRGEEPDPEVVADAALDLINYAGFILRLVEDGS